MNKEILLSVIVPIYNAEKWIERCARSLMEQTLINLNGGKIELIFIDDGTPDNSMEILTRIIDEYPDAGKCVRIIHNPQNFGITETRKRGIAEAKGVYVGWCDADDWCERDMFETMLKNTEDGTVDIVVCNSWSHVNKNGKEHVSENKFYPSPSPQDVIKNLWRKGREYHSFPISLWHQIIKRQLINNASKDIVPVNEGEDIYILLNCYYFASSAVWTEKPLYHYNCDNASSLSRRKLTRNDWKSQKENIKRFERLMKADSEACEYKRGLSYIKYMRKRRYVEIFNGCYEYWKIYRECYKDICDLTDTPRNKRLKVWLTYNIYPLYWIANHSRFC